MLCAGCTEVKDDICRLHGEGLGVMAIAKRLDVTWATVKATVDPAWREKRNEAHRKRQNAMRARKREEAAALAAFERERRIKAAVRRAGAALSESYAIAERMQDVLAQAHREATDTEARRALAEAGTHHRKMRDEIVRALGVS